MIRRRQQDVGSRGGSGALFRNGTMDFMAGWLLGYAQQGGMSPGALLDCYSRIRNGGPRSWVDVFARAAEASAARASAAEPAPTPTASVSAARTPVPPAAGPAEAWAAAQVANRAVLAMADPRSEPARVATERMTSAFEAQLRSRGSGLRRWDVPFRHTHLPAYVSEGFASADRLLIIVGGGDTYVEDLWFFGAREAERHDVPVLIVDLPGQGDTPSRGLHFGPSTIEGFRTVIDALHHRGFGSELVLMGWSGGGIFTTHVAATAPAADRITALVASTPVHDPVTFFQRAIPRVLQREPDSVPVRTVLALARRNRVLRAALARYDWQFGPGGIAGVRDCFAEMVTPIEELDLPTLALVGLAEDGESLRQATEVVDGVRPRHRSSELVRFGADTGAQAHCQVGNLPLALTIAFDWIDRVPRQVRCRPTPGGRGGRPAGGNREDHASVGRWSSPTR